MGRLSVAVYHPLALLLHRGVPVGPGPGLARPVLVGVAGVHHPGSPHLGSASPQVGESEVVQAVTVGHPVQLAGSTAISHAGHRAGLKACGRGMRSELSVVQDSARQCKVGV